MPCPFDSLREIDPACQELIEDVRRAPLLALMVLAAWRLGRLVATKVVEAALVERAQPKTEWPLCPKCGRRLRSKGFLPRQLTSLIGEIHWERRVGRCPGKCHLEHQVVPLDEQLGVHPKQQASWELKRVACALAVFVAFATAVELLGRLTGVPISAGAVWDWVQDAGKEAMERLDRELKALAKGEAPPAEALAPEVAVLPLVIGGDGVMVPFRPQAKAAAGRTAWRQVYVGILVRLRHRLTRRGEEVPELAQRRLVAVRGDAQALGERLWLESLRQGIGDAKVVAWISDGGRGLWGIFAASFAGMATGILDFYHAAQNLWKGAASWLDGRTKAARAWFQAERHRLRHGEHPTVLADLAAALNGEGLPESARATLLNVYAYLQKHQDHIDYQKFKELGLPLGSGMVESACKWLIQQRFKGVGMRWSDKGFDHLLHLRLAWVNGRFDDLFPCGASPTG